MAYTFTNDETGSIPLIVLEKDGLDDWLSQQSDAIKEWVKFNGFSAGLGDVVIVPGSDGAPLMALGGFDSAEKRARGRFHLSQLAVKLPEGSYRLAAPLPGVDMANECLGWLLTSYRFDRYRKKKDRSVSLVLPDGVDGKALEAIASGEMLLRDLVNTPTSDMGPDELEAAARDLADDHGAQVSSIIGDDLLSQNFPMIHTVGRASTSAPRLIDMSWGDEGPKLTLVGKGVCFDTGGLNVKPRASMAAMKKDMGGAASVLGLAHMIMALGVKVQLRVLIPAVENSIAGNAFRPGDILPSRKGLTVEINNTDAEGRLVLADALALAAEDDPDLIVSMATLTGAARIAVGSDIAPFYATDAALAAGLKTAAERVEDPVWELPFHTPYETKIEPGIADLDNAPSGGFAGSITAALFLKRFVGTSRYLHFDVYAWSSFNQPARPKGGCGQGVRALLAALPDLAKPA
jgi:leucyl aminopeptidase